jgi:hypothetical protein
MPTRQGHEYPFVLDALNERRMGSMILFLGGRDAIDKIRVRTVGISLEYMLSKRFYDLSDSERRKS